MTRTMPTESQVRAIIDAHVGSRVISYEHVHHHCNSHVYVTAEGGKKVIIRICDGPYWTDDSAKIHKFRREEHGWKVMSKIENLNVPNVLSVDISKRHFPQPFLVMTHIPGSPMSEILPLLTRAEQMNVIRQLGRAVHQVHNLTIDPFSMPKEAVKWIGNRESIEEDQIVLRDIGRLTKRALNNLEKFITRHASIFEEMDRDIVFLHGDIAFRNTMIERASGQWVVSGLVDAELSGYGPRGRDLRVLEPLDFHPLKLQGVRDSFRDGYGNDFPYIHYKLAYLAACMDPQYPNETLLQQLDSPRFSCDLDWLDIH